MATKGTYMYISKRKMLRVTSDALVETFVLRWWKQQGFRLFSEAVVVTDLHM